MGAFPASVEALSYSTWIRESSSLWAFPLFLFLHTLGMAIVAGGATVISCALLGVWPQGSPIRPLQRFYPVMWAGFAINLFTGLSMFMKDASSYSRNPDFYVKLALIAAGVALLARMRTQVFGDPRLDRGPVWRGAKAQAWGCLLCWAGAIVAGRLLAYLGPVAGL